jgi:hypothetical protein
MMALAIAALIFLAIVILVVGLWWVAQAERSVRARLKRTGPADSSVGILRTDASVARALGDSAAPARSAWRSAAQAT